MATDTLTATQRETLGVFDAAGAPLSTTEVASALDRGRRSTYERLDRLAEAGALETKKVGASARVWWRPRARRRETGAEPASLVSALEEYAIVGLDPEGRIRTWTPGAEAVTGYAAEQARGEHVSRLYTDADTAAGVPGAHLERARETGSVAEEGWRVRADGSRFRASVTITPMREEAGELTGYASVMRDVTERRAREEALRTERTQLERVLETGQVGVGVFDGDGEAIRTNRRFRDLLGRPAEAGDLELGEATVRELDGDPLPPAERPAQLAIATGEPVEDRHVSVETADGGRRILSVDAAPLADGGDSVVVTASDVTALVEQARRLEQRHEDLLAEFEEMFDRIDDAFFALDADWRFTYVNERAGEVLDRAPGRLVGENVWEAFPAAADSTFRDRYREAVQTSESVTFEEYFPPLGAWFAVSAYPSESGLSVYFRDVTERKRREAERERYAGLVDAVGEPVYELDEAGRFVFVNDAFLEYSGYGEEELLGEHVSVGMREADIDRVEGRILEHLAGDAEGPLTVEYEVESKGGERIPVENRISVLRDDDGSIRGTAGVMWDVSDRRERERELTERIRQQEAVTDLSTRALAVEDVDALLEEAVRTVADTLGVEYASALDLDAAGLEPNEDGFLETDERAQTDLEHVFAVGDVAGEPMLAHKASKEGVVAAEVAAGEPAALDYQAMPAAVFTDPEVGTVGLTEAEAEAEGFEPVVGEFRFRGSGRAMTTNHTEGFVRLVADEETGFVLGGQIVGPEASELVAEVALAVEMGATLEDVAATVHTHPTLAEATMEAAEHALGQAIHRLNR